MSNAIRFASGNLTAGVVCALALLFNGVAQAGECPADQVGANALAGAPTMPVGVTDNEIAAIDLSKENVRLDQHRLRMRQMVVAPGGIVPLHDHADRPALIMVTAGQIVENNSKCRAPILHQAGDVAREFLGTRHWWKNETAQPVMLTIGDIVNDRKPASMMEQR